MEVSAAVWAGGGGAVTAFKSQFDINWLNNNLALALLSLALWHTSDLRETQRNSDKVRIVLKSSPPVTETVQCWNGNKNLISQLL